MYKKKVNERDFKTKRLEELNTFEFERNLIDYEKIIQDFLKEENIIRNDKIKVTKKGNIKITKNGYFFDEQKIL